MVGAGVVGLSCAVRLLEAGHTVDVVARDLPLETTSAVAAALWYPYRAFPFERVTAWSATTYAELEALAARDDTGVRMLAGTELHRGRQPDPWWRDAVPALTRVTPPGPPYVDGWTFVAPVVEMPVYLGWLVGRLEELGGTLSRMALTALPDQVEVVVNATGPRRPPHRPTTRRCARPRPGGVRRAGRPRPVVARRAPARRTSCRAAGDIVVGGTDDEGEWDRRPTPTWRSGSWSAASRWCPRSPAPASSATGWGCGRRVREVRLEVEHVGDRGWCTATGTAVPGVTLSWGCADEVAGLVG